MKPNHGLWQQNKWFSEGTCGSLSFWQFSEQADTGCGIPFHLKAGVSAWVMAPENENIFDACGSHGTVGATGSLKRLGKVNVVDA